LCGRREFFRALASASRLERSDSLSPLSSTFEIVLLDDPVFPSAARMGATRSLSLMGQCLLMALAQARDDYPPLLVHRLVAG